MMLTQCSGSGLFRTRLRTRVTQILVPCDAPHALVVDHVALALDVRGFGRVTQILVPCDAPHALVVDHVALALDVCGFGRGAAQIVQILVPCDAPHALVVDHVALALDVRGFGRVILVPCDAPHALVVDHVALALDVRGFGRGAAQITQILVPCDAPHGLVIDHVAFALDVRVFDSVAIPHGTCPLEARASHIVPLKHALRIDPRANGTHFVELVKCCVFEEQQWDIAIKQRETSHLRIMQHIVVKLYEGTRCGCLVVWVQIDTALVLENSLWVNDCELAHQHYVTAIVYTPQASTPVSGDTPQASTPVVTTHTAPAYLHALSGADDGEVGALMGINVNLSSITNIGDSPHANTVYQSY